MGRVVYRAGRGRGRPLVYAYLVVPWGQIAEAKAATVVGVLLHDTVNRRLPVAPTGTDDGHIGAEHRLTEFVPYHACNGSPGRDCEDYRLVPILRADLD